MNGHQLFAQAESFGLFNIQNASKIMIGNGSCNCVSVIHAIAEMPKVLALIALNAQGETDDRPRTFPKISMISDSAAAAMAAQQTGLELPESTAKNDLDKGRTVSFIDAARQP